ncbi:hypothetical protein CH294_00415 [Rhodococcus sp. 14-2483-1-1]|uniref:DUF6412 domain-containing protein n=1 Tax=Rhodococcus sp. 14-2483-1-1 TaxID=2023148 RepID=UPI000B9B15D3|nr:DUF6412 domain-containing protein [Rhodococcus sp. 14-2483-1-1]OZF41476.1 hypothetical protein CH294_00415 [Rhodococcus sp. 14-2483-1-1]
MLGFRSHACRLAVRRHAITLVGILSVLLVVFTVVDAQPAAQIAMFGALVAASLLTFGAPVDPGVVAPRSTCAGAADGRRLRGSFRRQEHPDTPGRPMPRAPGSVFRPDRWLVFC